MAVPESRPDNDLGLRAALREGLQAELAQTDPAAGLDRLHARLRAQPHADRAHAPVRVAKDWRSALRGGLHSWFSRWPTALASLVIVLQAGLLAWQWQAPADDVAWRSTGAEALGRTAVLRVHFAPQARLQAVTALLHQLQAEVLAGPDGDNLWTLAVPSAQRDAAVAQLRASGLVQAVHLP